MRGARVLYCNRLIGFELLTLIADFCYIRTEKSTHLRPKGSLFVIVYFHSGFDQLSFSRHRSRENSVCIFLLFSRVILYYNRIKKSSFLPLKQDFGIHSSHDSWNFNCACFFPPFGPGHLSSLTLPFASRIALIESKEISKEVLILEFTSQPKPRWFTASVPHPDD